MIRRARKQWGRKRVFLEEGHSPGSLTYTAFIYQRTFFPSSVTIWDMCQHVRYSYYLDIVPNGVLLICNCDFMNAENMTFIAPLPIKTRMMRQQLWGK